MNQLVAGLVGDRRLPQAVDEVAVAHRNGWIGLVLAILSFGLLVANIRWRSEQGKIAFSIFSVGFALMAWAGFHGIIIRGR